MLKSCLVAVSLLTVSGAARAIAPVPVSDHGEHKKSKKEPKQEGTEEHGHKEHGEHKKDY